MYREKTIQIEAELAEFIELLRLYNVKSYLEIGSEDGGSLWRVATSLPAKSRIVSIDMMARPPLCECIKALNERGYSAHLLPFDSTKSEAVHMAAVMSPYDAIFIDANHTIPYVTADWLNYGPLGKIIAFHDINAPYKPYRRNPMQVKQLWRGLRGGVHRTKEIIAPGSHQGIGVLWR